MSTVRTRFAPSPTGYMHVGNLRTALYTYLQARHNGGTFILRIEDTDQGRLVEGATDIIYGTLKATGLTWDEGPDVGGPVGPYVQSQRMGMFKQYAEQLVKAGKAYYCFCTEERLNEMHEAQRAAGEMTHYDGHCRHLSAEEVAAKLAAGEPYVIRQKIPESGGGLHPQSAAGIPVLLFLAFISGAGYVIWALLMKNNPVSRIAVFGLIIPIMNVLLSALLNSEPLFEWNYLAALVLV